MNTATPPPGPEPDRYSCHVAIPGWRLHVAHLTLAEGRDHGDVMDLAADGSAEMLRNALPDGRIAEGSMLAEIRESLGGMGHDPDRLPTVAELLVREFHTTGTVPRGTLAWDFLVLLMAKSQAPWTVIDPKELTPPLVFREGLPGETHQHAGGQLDCAGLPVLADSTGVVASPWTHRRPDDLENCQSPLFICFLPRELFRKVQPRTHVGNALWLTWIYKFIFERTCSYDETAA